MTATIYIRKRLNQEHRSRKYPTTWRAIATRYGVNVRYIYDLAIHGKEPTNSAVRQALGLQKLPKPARVIPAWLDEAVSNLEQLLDKKQQLDDT